MAPLSREAPSPAGSPLAAPSPLIRALADRYRIEGEVGRGGMATVYLATDLKHGRQVAIKALNPDLAPLTGQDRFLREIEIAARLSHPPILPLFDSGAAGDLLYYVMPYVRGESLRARLDREGMLPVDDALRLAREIASALGYAHHQGIVHRDIKPENILLTDGIALVADFGIARAIRAAAASPDTAFATQVGLVLGTPLYMSPEQATGDEIDGRADLYALACGLYEMLAGQPPFTGPTQEAVWRAHLLAEARPVSELRTETPPGVASAIARALAKNPDDRYPTAAHFAEALTLPMSAGLVPTPPSGPAAAAPNNLPRPRTSFVGREPELAEGARLLGETRLLTLTGVGGSGKTRLALQLADRVLADFLDGVWFVDLAPLTDGNRLAETVAAALEVTESPDAGLVELLRRHVAGRRMLLLLDNCEHLLSDCAWLADQLLEAGPGLRILATSREGLGVEGERLVSVRSLSTPPRDQAADREAVAATDAARLFLDRARAVAPDFSLTDENAAPVAEICRRLDGIPLAIELAAARVKVLSVEQIRARLDDRFRLLTGGSRTALPRQRTLEAAIGWSYDHLPVEEQHLFRRLAVFGGGWTLEAATRVGGESGDEFQALDLLTRLVDKSLVVVERRAGGATRYRMLETVRQYGQERLSESGEGEVVRRRHVEFFRAMAQRAHAERLTRETRWLAELEVEHDNLRAALALLRDTDAEGYLELAGLLGWFWQGRSHYIEGLAHVDAALDASAPEPDRPARARALFWRAFATAWKGDGALGIIQMAEALRTWRALGDLDQVAAVLEGMGWAQFAAGEDEAALATFEEFLRFQQERRDPAMINRARVAVGQVLVALHRTEEARPMAQEILEYSRAHGDDRGEHSGWHYLADCALMEGNYPKSLSLYRQSLAAARRVEDRLEMSFEVQGIAMSHAGLGNARLALQLLAAARAEWARIGVDLKVRFWENLLERHGRLAQDALEPEAAAAAREEGLRMGFEQALVLAGPPA